MIQSLQIGPVTYEVVEVADLHDTDRDGKKRWLHGHVLYAESKIEVDANQSEDRKTVTLWHEAIHGILEHAGLDHSEQVVIALGFGLVQLVRDNPNLIALTQEVRSKER